MTRSRSTAAPWPTPSELERAPELATLAVVHDSLDLLGSVLCVAHPRLLTSDPDDELAERMLSPPARTANQLLVLTERMLDAIREYRRCIIPPEDSDPDDQIPF